MTPFILMTISAVGLFLLSNYLLYIYCVESAENMQLSFRNSQLRTEIRQLQMTGRGIRKND